VVVIAWYLDLQLPMQSVPIATNVVSLTRSQGGVLDTILCDKFVSDLRQVGGPLRVLRFPPAIKLTTTI
jgi:hypothetical protein